MNKFAPRDPENMDPYGPQNHPLPEKAEKDKSMTVCQLSEALGMSCYLSKSDQENQVRHKE